MSEFIIQIEKLLSAFGDAEYRFLLLEPLIFYGLLLGVGMLVAGFFFKAPKVQTAAIVVIGLAALTHLPYKEARLAAQPRMDEVYKISSPSRVKGFNENTKRWVANSWQFRLLICLATATVMIGVKRNRIGFGLAVATAVLGLFAAKNAMWLNYQDAIAYHPNLKVHEVPIDEKKVATSIPTAPPKKTPKKSETRPKPASTETIAPASLTKPLSAPSTSVSPLRIPPPEVPINAPRPRQVQPLPRY